MSGVQLDQEVTIQQITEVICRHGLRMPALLGLEAGRPLAFFGGQLLWLAQPFLSLFFPHRRIAAVAILLEDPSAINALIDCLEASEG
jgi:hypothetical protein